MCVLTHYHPWLSTNAPESHLIPRTQHPVNIFCYCMLQTETIKVASISNEYPCRYSKLKYSRTSLNPNTFNQNNNQHKSFRKYWKVSNKKGRGSEVAEQRGLWFVVKVVTATQRKLKTQLVHLTLSMIELFL